MVIDSKTWAPKRPPIFPYSCYISPRLRYGGAVTKWLLENIGIVNQDWEYQWYRSKMHFKTEEDKVKFILRWT